MYVINSNLTAEKQLRVITSTARLQQVKGELERLVAPLLGRVVTYKTSSQKTAEVSINGETHYLPIRCLEVNSAFAPSIHKYKIEDIRKQNRFNRYYMLVRASSKFPFLKIGDIVRVYPTGEDSKMFGIETKQQQFIANHFCCVDLVSNVPFSSMNAVKYTFKGGKYISINETTESKPVAPKPMKTNQNFTVKARTVYIIEELGEDSPEFESAEEAQKAIELASKFKIASLI